MRLGNDASPCSSINRKHRITESSLCKYALSSEEDSGFIDKLSDISPGMKQIK